MPKIQVLDEQTIDKIAAGEVVERPSSVVKELVENAIDAKATAVTVEIRDGGTTLIRITDNGCGIERAQIPVAFFRHSTSKLRNVEDLLTISSLGFRGEALSSIAAVAQVELITKTREDLTGSRYVIEGGKEKSFDEIGAPEGTTFLVKNLFYNTPARRKFLKTAQTEAGYISDLMERMALSNPEISFKFINQGQIRLHTSGNGQLKDIIYHIYGRDITANLLKISGTFDSFSVEGFIGKPVISRGNRNFESYFINGRYIKSKLLAKTIEDAYHGFMMQHKYPFTVLRITMDGSLVDVNVHPNKMEIRFSNQEEIYNRLSALIRETLKQKELIPDVTIGKQERQAARPLPDKKAAPEPFEKARLEKLRASVAKDSPYERKYEYRSQGVSSNHNNTAEQKESFSKPIPQPVLHVAEDTDFHSLKKEQNVPVKDQEPVPSENIHPDIPVSSSGNEDAPVQEQPAPVSTAQQIPVQKSAKPEAADENRKPQGSFVQASIFDQFPDTKPLLDPSSRKEYRIIGQLFDTYWLIEFGDKFYMVDQHAAHEKVLYERTMKAYKEKDFTSQMISPPIILFLTMREEILLKRHMDAFTSLGFDISPFGGKEYAVNAVPANLYGLNGQNLLVELIDGLSDISEQDAPEMVLEKVASMSCKAAVKGNDHLSKAESEALLDDLMKLENPYFCPHGRPVIISMSKYEIEKKFKRILS